MTAKVWDFWANRYERLWVQKYSLTPTRNCISMMIGEDLKDLGYKEDNVEENYTQVLDIGCGPGELINLLSKRFDNLKITGLDFSQEMLNISKREILTLFISKWM